MDSLRTVYGKESFWLKKNEWNVVSEVHSLPQLLEKLRASPPDVVFHHLANGRNDFASWVENVLKDETLANKIRQVRRDEPEAQKKICSILEKHVSKANKHHTHPV